VFQIFGRTYGIHHQSELFGGMDDTQPTNQPTNQPTKKQTNKQQTEKQRAKF